jgi:hypothetical protein
MYIRTGGDNISATSVADLRLSRSVLGLNAVCELESFRVAEAHEQYANSARGSELNEAVQVC